MTIHKQRPYNLPAAACIVVLWISQTSMALVVSEIMYQPADEPERHEFIELHNRRAVFEDLSGYAFTNGIRYEFEPGTIIEAGGYLVVAKDPAALEAAYGITGVFGPFDGRLDNSGERIELCNANGGIVLSVRYDRQWPWSAVPTGTGHSLVLASLAGDPSDAKSWAPSTYIGGTPGGPDPVQAWAEDPTVLTLVDIGDPGRYFKGTHEPAPDRLGRATTDWTHIDFDDDPNATAWLDGPNGYGYSNDPAELQYIGTHLDDMHGNYVSVYARLRFTLTAEQIACFTRVQADVHYDDDFVLYLNGVRVGHSDNISGHPPAFDQTGTRAWDPPMMSVDLTDRVDLLVPGTNVLAIQAHNVRLSGSSDAFGAPILWAVVDEAEHAADARARILINEVFTGTANDWIELYNPGPMAVDLSDAYLSNTAADLLRLKIPDGIVLQPGEFWTVAASPSEDLPLGLAYAGMTVYLTAASRGPVPTPIRILDAVRYAPLEPGTAFGRFPDGADNLVALSAPTPGARNAYPWIGDIVINEIMYHHPMREERFEYVELYNRSDRSVDLGGWAFTEGIRYTFEDGTVLPPDSYLVVGNDPEFLAELYDHLVVGVNVVGPYSGRLSNRRDLVRLSYPFVLHGETYLATADEVLYSDCGHWSQWPDGRGASLERRDPDRFGGTPGAWMASDESGKSAWQPFAFTIDRGDTRYTHDQINVFDMIMLNAGEVLLDDLELVIDGSNRLTNGGFESGTSGWRLLGTHVRSFATTADSRSGARSLHLIATGRGETGTNRINQSVGPVHAGTVTFRGWARWLRGGRFLLLRTARERSPVQPPRPAHVLELDMPLDLGTPGLPNTTLASAQGPDILDVRHAPVLPAGGEPIVVTARVIGTGKDSRPVVSLSYRSEGQTTFTQIPMVDDGSGDDRIAGDCIYTATIPGAGAGTMRAFHVEAFDSAGDTRFPTRLEPTAEAPERTCLVRVGDTQMNTQFATYRVWLSDDVLDAFRSRPNRSNELLDCTFVYNDTEILYNARIRYRGSPFIRSGSGRDPRERYAYRIDFKHSPGESLRGRKEINLDNTEGTNRGPLQERASYWFYRQMALPYSTQEFVRLIVNGRSHRIYEDVQKVDSDYIEMWFGDDDEGYLHKIDDYFEFNVQGTEFSNRDEGLRYGSQHPPIPETYRWGFKKRSHRQDDRWNHLFDFAAAMNTPSSSSTYQRAVESVIHPERFAAVLAIRHALGDWDSYGYRRSKNNYFYYALPEGKWYLLPWDIDFTLGSGDGPSTGLPPVHAGIFPEVHQFVNHTKYEQMYWDAMKALVEGPWQTSYGTDDPPMAFDRFLDDASAALVADGLGTGRRDGIKQFVRSRRNSILSQMPPEPTHRFPRP